MAATLTRRTLRRARLGGRHAYRTAFRHRAALAVAAAVAALTVGSGVAIGHDAAPPEFGPPAWSHPQMHGPMPGALPDHPREPLP